jgi:hypothetical protein
MSTAGLLRRDFSGYRLATSGGKSRTLPDVFDLTLNLLSYSDVDRTKFLLGTERITAITDGGLVIRYVSGNKMKEWQPGGVRPVLSLEVSSPNTVD